MRQATTESSESARIAFALAAICGLITAATLSGQVTHQLTIARAPGAGAILTEEGIDLILRQASNVLRSDDTRGADKDTSCCITLERRPGSIIQEAKSIPANINTRPDFDKAAKDPISYVKVVNSITWCGDKKPVKKDPNEAAPVYWGCGGNVPKPSVVVVYELIGLPEEPEDFLGILVAHEYGHSKGIEDDDTSPTRLMNSVSRDFRRKRMISPEDCKKYQRAHPPSDAPGARTIP